MNCWNIILRVKGKTQEEIKEFKDFVQSMDFPFDFQRIIPIHELSEDDKNNLYLSFWNTYYRPTFSKIIEEPPTTLWYNFDADGIPYPIFQKISSRFPKIKFDVYAELDRKYILGGGLLKTVFKFNYLKNKNQYEINDYSPEVYQEEIIKKIKRLNRKNSANQFEMEELIDLISVYNDYKDIPDKQIFLQSTYQSLWKFPRIQNLLKATNPGAFREASIKNILSGL